MEKVEYRPGLEGIIAGQTSISEINPENEQLAYRGYEIRELAEKSTYEEVAYLLLMERLPTAEELQTFHRDLAANRPLPQALVDFLGKLPRNAKPMDTLRTAVSILGEFDPDGAVSTHEANLRKAKRLIAQCAVVIAAAYRLGKGQKPVDSDPALSHAENFLYILKGERPDPAQARIFDATLVMYAEHGFNASTFSARVTASTLSDLYAAVTSAVGTLKGPLHGGANEEAMKMLLEIGEPARAEAWVRQALAEKRRIMGFGHREYKKGDPRALIGKRLTRELSARLGQNKWMEMCERLEAVVKEEKGLFPNVDFYTAPIYYLLALPMELYTPMFALSRVAGWSAHVIEQLEHNRLIRPEAEYTGPRNLSYVPITQR